MEAQVVEALAFYLFASITVFAGFMVISSKNPVHSVLFLILAFFNSAALFVLLGAEFLAMLMIIVYVGAVAVLFLFVVMMLDINYSEMREGMMQNLPMGGLIGAIITGELLFVAGTSMSIPDGGLLGGAKPTPDLAEVTNTEAIGAILFTDYIYVFQAAGMVLFVAMVGAIVLTHRTRPGVKRQVIADQNARTPEDAIEVVKVETGKGI
jgi:NADH-quinone oxidoreductase subunit J